MMSSNESVMWQTGIMQLVQERIKDIEEKMKKSGGYHHTWATVKEKVINEFKSLQKLAQKELDMLTEKIDKMFHRVEHHVLHKEVSVI